MPRFPKVGLLLLAAGLLSLPSQAHAQFIVRGASPTWGGVGGWGSGGWGFGGWVWGGWGYGGFGAMGGYGWSPYGGATALSYNSAWTFPVRYYRDIPIDVYVPGFAASEAPRMRQTLYPAISARPQRAVSEVPRLEHNESRACIAMQLPCASAKVYLDGVPTMQVGPHRRYVTPILNPASRYCFDVEVRWQDDAGQSRRLKRQVDVRAGETTSVDLRGE